MATEQDLEQLLARAAAADAYRLALSDALRDERDPAAIYGLGARMLADHLHVNRSTYCRVDGEDLIVEATHADGVPMIAGRLPLAINGGAVREALAARRPIAVDDVHADARLTSDEAAFYMTYGSRAFVSVPVIRSGACIGVTSVVSATPRAWRQDEIDLVSDTTERIWLARQRATAEHERACAVQALDEANRRKDEFIAMLSHELRNPLAPLRTGIDVLRVVGTDPAVAGALLAVMDRQLSHITHLVDDLLDAARISRGTIELRRTVVTLRDIVETAVDANRVQIAEQRLTMDVKVSDSGRELYADSTRLVQALSNLIHNATKFTPPLGRIEVSATVEGGSVCLAVSDTGIGIEPELRPRLFELFARGEGSRGLGIGLALARHVVELHGGSIAVESAAAGRGCRFVMRVPIGTSGVSAPSSVITVSATKRKVLIIDDNVDAARAVAMLVKVMGGVAHVAHDGPSALTVASDVLPEVIFLDIGMPGMDGYEVCRRLRATHGADVKIVALTGWGKEEDRQRAVDAGFDAHITKPPPAAALRAFL